MPEGAGQLVFIAPVQRATGNHTTVERLRGYFAELFDGVQVVDAEADGAAAAAAALLPSAAAVVLLHAWRSGAPYLAAVEAAGPAAAAAPVVVVFGGTDVNEMAAQPERLDVMSRAVARAAACVSFSGDMRERARHLWPGLRVEVIPQAVAVAPASVAADADVALRRLLSAAGGPDDDAQQVFLAPMGLRAVKDPLFAAAAFPAVHREFPHAWLLILGHRTDARLARRLDAACGRGTGVLYHTAVPQAELHAALRAAGAAGVVNCSTSEGQPQAALEGMVLGAAALLRSIPGNAACAGDAEAVMFSTPAEFAEGCAQLLRDPVHRGVVAAAGRRHARRRFAAAAERGAYVRLLHELCAALPEPPGAGEDAELDLPSGVGHRDDAVLSP